MVSNQARSLRCQYTRVRSGEWVLDPLGASASTLQLHLVHETAI